jgi:hypothetical protein
MQEHKGTRATGQMVPQRMYVCMYVLACTISDQQWSADQREIMSVAEG